MNNRHQDGAGGRSPTSLRSIFIAMAVLLGYIVVSTALLHRFFGESEAHEILEFVNYIFALLSLGGAYYVFVVRPTVRWEQKEAATRARLAELSEAIENMSGVTPVPAAAEALAELENDPHFDLLFTDVIMPGAMTGADLARDVARRGPSIRLLMTSGYTEATVLGKVRMPEGVRLLSKPYSNAELADAVQKALDDGGGPKARVA